MPRATSSRQCRSAARWASRPTSTGLTIGVENGVVDLRTGSLRDGERNDRVTKHAPVVFDETAGCPRFEEFLERVQPNPEIRRYLQRVAGYSLTGDVSEQDLLDCSAETNCIGNWVQNAFDQLVGAGAAGERKRPYRGEVAQCATNVQRPYRAVVWALSRVLPPIDALFAGRRRSLTSIGTGLPLCYLTTTGRRTGEPRTVPLVHVADGERVVLVGSNWGRRRGPAWALNLEADPAARISMAGVERWCRARPTGSSGPATAKSRSKHCPDGPQPRATPSLLICPT